MGGLYVTSPIRFDYYVAEMDGAPAGLFRLVWGIDGLDSEYMNADGKWVSDGSVVEDTLATFVHQVPEAVAVQVASQFGGTLDYGEPVPAGGITKKTLLWHFDTKRRVWVHPYIREGFQIEGYWRDLMSDWGKEILHGDYAPHKPEEPGPWQQTKDEFIGPRSPGDAAFLESYDPGKGTEAELARASAIYEAERVKRRKWEASIGRALSLGWLSYDQAKERGYWGHGDEAPDEYVKGRGWQVLPPVLFHVTTAKSAVEATGLKSRDELHLDSAAGLGAGSSDTVSFATDPAVAQAIERGVREARAVLREDISLQQLFDNAESGADAERPYLKDFYGYYNSTEQPIGLKLLLEHKKIDQSYGIYPRTMAEWAVETGLPEEKLEPYGPPLEGGDGQVRYPAVIRPLTDDEYQNAVWDVYRTLAGYRERAGGPLDPLFMSVDIKALANTPEDQIATLRFQAREGAQGWPMRALSEWRTKSGDTVVLATPEAGPHPLHEAFHDQVGNRAYRTSNGDYHYRLSGNRPGGPKTPWSDAVREAFPDHLDFVRAAHEYIRPQTFGGSKLAEVDVKDLDFERLHPRYPRGHPRAGEFMDKPDFDRWLKLKPLRELVASKPTERSRNRPPIEHALDAVERVLRLPNLPDSAKVKIRHGGVRREGMSARFEVDKHEVILYDQRVSGTVRHFPDMVGSSNAVVHELAHWIDHVAIGRGFNTQDRVDRYHAQNKDDFASGIVISANTRRAAGVNPDLHRALDGWIDAVLASDTFQALDMLRRTHLTFIVTFPDSTEEVRLPVDTEYIDYLLNPVEVWARTFEQYIASRSHDTLLQYHVQSYYDEVAHSAIPYQQYWAAKDFEPIAAAMDELFARLGWLNPAEGKSRAADIGVDPPVGVVAGMGRAAGWKSSFDPLDHPRFPVGWPGGRGGEFMEKPDVLVGPEMRLKFGEGTLTDLLAVLQTRWRPQSEREAREWGHAIYMEVEKDRGLKAARTREHNLYDEMSARDGELRDALRYLDEAEHSLRDLAEHPERYEPNEVALVNEEYGSRIDQLRADALDKEYKLSQAANKWDEARVRLVHTHQNALTRVFEQIHYGFGESRFKLKVGGDTRESVMEPEIKRAKKEIEAVSRFLPPSWIEGLNRAGYIGVLVGKGRAQHQEVRTLSPEGDARVNSVIRLAPNSPERAAMHEMGHRVQSVFPWVHEIEREFHTRRAGDEGVTQLYDPPDPEYGREFAQKDQFFDPYVGKVYPTEPRFQPSIYDDPREIVSMGLEHLWYGGPYSIYPRLIGRVGGEQVSVWEADREHAELMLGLLASRPA